MANAEKKNINFEAYSLLKELLDKGQIRNLVSVKTKEYPEYCFKGTDAVLQIVASFMATHDLKCDRSVEDWSEYDRLVLNTTDKPETIVTRNLEAVKTIVTEGYGYMLKRTGVDQYKKKFFVFYVNDRILEIKENADLKSKEKFESQHKNTKKELANTQMSELLKKAREEKR